MDKSQKIQLACGARVGGQQLHKSYIWFPCTRKKLYPLFIQEDIVMTVQARIQEAIDRAGHAVIAVPDAAPGFCYTVGLEPKLGFEFLVIGLPYHFGHPLLNELVEKWKPEMLGKDTTGFSNLPIAFLPVDKELELVHDKYMVQADIHNMGWVNVVQVVLSDMNGLFFWHPDYDHEYMDPRQPIYVEVPHGN